MNDFTKEELTVIHLAVMRDMNQFAHILKTSPSMLALKEKLESMIDNYCEHENDERFCMMPLPGNPKMCTKCQGFYI